MRTYAVEETKTYTGTVGRTIAHNCKHKKNNYEAVKKKVYCVKKKNTECTRIVSEVKI